MNHPLRFAITVDQAQGDETDQCTGTCQQQITLTHCERGRAREPRTDAVTQGDDADPRQHGVGGAQAQVVGEFDPAAIMQNRPRQVQRRSGREVQGIEQVVQTDYGQAQDTQYWPR
ncbi:hypothetical protein D3C76_1222170 [compost metagenome]